MAHIDAAASDLGKGRVFIHSYLLTAGFAGEVGGRRGGEPVGVGRRADGSGRAVGLPCGSVDAGRAGRRSTERRAGDGGRSAGRSGEDAGRRSDSGVGESERIKMPKRGGELGFFKN
jgi:hypothetical protein